MSSLSFSNLSQQNKDFRKAAPAWSLNASASRT